jgi:transposase InsO family protein
MPGFVLRQLKRDQYILDHDGVLLYRNNNKNPEKGQSAPVLRVVVPGVLKLAFLQYYHKSTIAIHQGRDRMRANMKHRLYWIGMDKDIGAYCESCHDCQVVKTRPNKRHGLMQQFRAKRPFELVAVDLVGPLPVTTKDNVYIMSMMDLYSNMIQLVPLKNKLANNVAINILDNWVYRYGPMTKLLSDLGSEFISDVLKVMCGVFGIKKLFTTAYSPSTNGQLERFHDYLKQRLALIMDENEMDFFDGRGDWDNYLAAIAFSYNNTINRMTKYAPYTIIYNHAIVYPGDMILDFRAIRESIPTLSKSKREFIEMLEKQSVIINENLQRSHKHYDEQRRRYYDRKQVEYKYKVDDIVMFFVGDRYTGTERKLYPKFLGPFRVIEIKSPVLCKIQHIRDQYKMDAHVRKLKQYHLVNNVVSIDIQRQAGKARVRRQKLQEFPRENSANTNIAADEPRNIPPMTAAPDAEIQLDFNVSQNVSQSVLQNVSQNVLQNVSSDVLQTSLESKKIEEKEEILSENEKSENKIVTTDNTKLCKDKSNHARIGKPVEDESIAARVIRRRRERNALRSGKQ